MPSTGALQSVSVYMAAGATGFVGVYDNTGSGGSGGNLIATSASTVFGTGWVTASMTTNPTVSSGAVIWLAFLSTTAGYNVGADTSALSSYYEGGDSRTFLPATLGSQNVDIASQVAAIYATFQPPVIPANPFVNIWISQ